MYGGIEAGGSRFRCAVGNGDSGLVERVEIPTTRPEATLGAVRDFFRAAPKIERLGIASFGPLDIDPRSSSYGTILYTPKPGWSGTDLRRALEPLEVEAVFQTDVVGAALAEGRHGAARDAEALVYMTVGTGIGAGVVEAGRVRASVPHSEFGHFYPKRAAGDEDFPGVCPFHGDCLEGLASGPALAARWGMPADEITSQTAWNLQAHYLAQGCVAILRLLAPQRIVLGGGVMRRSGLLDLIRDRCAVLLGGYHAPDNLERVLVAPGLGDDAGVLGALMLAERGGA